MWGRLMRLTGFRRVTDMEWTAVFLPGVLAGFMLVWSGLYGPRKTVPSEIRAEIDQTPEWWDREFRRLSGVPEPTTPYGLWVPDASARYQFVDMQPPTTEELNR